MSLAEGVGFEPTDACTSPVFKTGAIDHSATLPETGIIPKLWRVAWFLQENSVRQKNLLKIV